MRVPHRIAAIVTGALGGVRPVLAAVGLYGLMAVSAMQRTREIGIRVALGAATRPALTMMLFDGLRTAAIGVVIGLALPSAAARAMAACCSASVRSMSGRSGDVAVLAAIVPVAIYLPVRRGASRCPLLVLRDH